MQIQKKIIFYIQDVMEDRRRLKNKIKRSPQQNTLPNI